MTVNELLEQAKNLSVEDRKELAKLLIDTLAVVPPAAPQRRLSELRGLGSEIWQGIDAQDYVNQMRDEWDKRS